MTFAAQAAAERIEIVRVYPRLTVGGAERDILVLLRGIGRTRMVVPGFDGPAGDTARGLASDYRLLTRRRFAGLVEACRGARVVHLHTINDAPLPFLAARLAGAEVVVQTLHNELESRHGGFVDHSIVLDEGARGLLDAPRRATVIASGIPVPAELPARAPITERPLRLLEIRRPGKPMAFTLEELLATSAFDGLDIEARVVGIEGDAADRRVQRLGVTDPTPHLGWADVLVHGTAAETFGRVVYEAMAHGALPATTPLPVLRRAAQRGAAILSFSSGDPATAALELRGNLEALAADPDTLERLRRQNHDFARAHVTEERMVDATAALYERLLTAPRPHRSFGPEDFGDGDPALLATLVDAEAEHAPLLLPSGAAGLGPRQRAVYLWFLAHQGLVRRAARRPILEECRRVLGDRYDVCHDLGHALLGEGRPAEAAAAFRCAVGLDPERVGARAGLVRAAAAAGDARTVTRELDALARLCPDHPTVVELVAAFGRFVT